VTKQEDYRLYVIHKLPKLKILDFKKIKPKERKEAIKKFGSLEEDTKGEKKDKTATNTFVVGDGVPTQTQTKKKGLSSEQRRKIMEAIKKATSLGEIERLEKILSSGKIPSDFDFDKEAKPVPESENNTDSQTASKKGEDSSESKLEAKQENKGTETKVEKKNKDSAEKEKSDKSKTGEESNQTEGEGETEGLADQEPDEGDASSRWEKADAQVDIDMTE